MSLLRPVRALVVITAAVTPTRALLSVFEPANDQAGDIVPERDAKLCKRHDSCPVAMATVRGYPVVVWTKVSPRYVAW